MKPIILSLLSLFLLQTICYSVSGKPLVLTDKQNFQIMAPYLEILEDPDTHLTIEEASSPQLSHRYFQNQHKNFNAGYTKSAYWIHFNLTNPTKNEIKRFLEIDYPTLNYIDLFSQNSLGRFTKLSTGDHYPFSHRKIENRNFLFELTIPAQTRRAFYLRVQSTAINLPLYLWQATALNHKIMLEYSLLGIYLGGLLIIAIFNLFIFTSVKEKVYLYYVFYTIGFALTEASLNGMAFQYLWPNQLWWTDRSIVLVGGFSTFWGYQFSRIFINTPKLVPRLDKVLLIGMAWTVITMIICLFNYSLGNQLVSSSILIMAPLLIGSGFICLKRGSYTARYYTIAWILVLCGVSIHLLKTFGFLPSNLFTNWADELGSLAEVSLLSFGLAARINLLKRAEKEKAQELHLKNLELKGKNKELKEYECSLEQKITDRTQELNIKNTMLNTALADIQTSNLKLQAEKEKAESADKAKSEFLSNISHELRTPMQGILGFAKLGFERIEIVGTEKLSEYFTTIYASGHRLLSLINDLLDLSRMEAGKENYDFRKGNLSRLAKLVIYELQTLIEEKQTQVELDIPENEKIAHMDHGKIIQVIRNFVSNAIKFSPAESRIIIKISNQEPDLQFSIFDRGIGIPEAELNSIFGKFSQSTRTKSNAGGTGLGLAICKKVIEDHQGKIWAENNPEGGAIFHFIIPTQLNPTNSSAGN